jgi:hypothetical protein
MELGQMLSLVFATPDKTRHGSFSVTINLKWDGCYFHDAPPIQSFFEKVTIPALVFSS